MSRPKTKPAKNNAEWARNTQKELEANDHSTAVRVGDWTVSTQTDTGNLIASNINGGSIILAVKPAASDNADEVAGTGQAFIKVERQATQNEPRGTTALVEWDSVAYQTPGWGFAPTATDIVVPEDGVYTIKFHLAFTNSSAIIGKGVVLIDAVVKMSQEFDPDTAWYQSMYMVEDYPLNAGNLISCGAFVSGGGTFDFGASSADPAVFTSLSILKLAVED